MLGEVKPEDVKIGMRVRAVWKKAKDREGAITDILYFKPNNAEPDSALFPTPVKPVEINAVTAGQKCARIPLTYKYTAGVAGKAFCEALLEGRIVGTRSPRTEKLLVPPSIFDEIGMDAVDHEEQLVDIDPNSGFLESFTTVHEDRSGEMLDQPLVIAQVRFPDVDGSIFGKLVLDAGDAPVIGAAVGLVKPASWSGPDDVSFKLL
jgi:uncharacterized OB-fold protein